MTHFRFRWRVDGGHVRIRVFAGKDADLTHGNCGTLVMTIAEWDELRLMLQVHPHRQVEFVEEL